MDALLAALAALVLWIVGVLPILGAIFLFIFAAWILFAIWMFFFVRGRAKQMRAEFNTGWGW